MAPVTWMSLPIAMGPVMLARGVSGVMTPTRSPPTVMEPATSPAPTSKLPSTLPMVMALALPKVLSVIVPNTSLWTFND